MKPMNHVGATVLAVTATVLTRALVSATATETDFDFVPM